MYPSSGSAPGNVPKPKDRMHQHLCLLSRSATTKVSTTRRTPRQPFHQWNIPLLSSPMRNPRISGARGFIRSIPRASLPQKTSDLESE